MGFLAVLLVILAIGIVIGFLVTGFNFVSFLLTYASENGNSDFWTPDNFWAWVLCFIGLMVLAAILRFVFKFVWMILFIPINIIAARLAMKAKDGAMISVVLGSAIIAYIAGVVFTITFTIFFMDYLSQFPEYTSYFRTDNTAAWIFSFLYFLGIVIPNRDEKSNA